MASARLVTGPLQPDPGGETADVVDFTIAGTIALATVLDRLRERRPVFHSEADLQFALAWEIQLAVPQLHIRLERPLAPGTRLDLLVADPDWKSQTAIELKYLTARWSGEVQGERFELAAQGAQDIRCYDVVKDIARVEDFVSHGSGRNGAVIVLSNDGYWRKPTHDRVTNAHQFRLHEGTTLTSERSWGPNASPGTTNGREQPIRLHGSHHCQWNPYTELPGRNGELRVLVFPIMRMPARRPIAHPDLRIEEPR
jgi:hypothetical protein